MWKRIVLGALAFILLAGAGVAVIVYRTLAPLAPTVAGAQLGRATSVVDQFVQAFVVDLGDGTVALIDAGQDPEAKAIRAELSRRGLTPDAVRAVLVTHGHGDHVGGVAAFPNAAVYAHQDEVPLLDGRTRGAAPVRHFSTISQPVIRVTNPIQDGAVLAIGGATIRAFHVPGHTAGSTAYLVDGVLFLGDTVFGRKDGALDPVPSFISDDAARNRRSLEHLASALTADQVSVLAPAHSGPVSGADLLARLRAAANR